MSINKLISIKHAIIDAMDMMALDHKNHFPILMVWATDAEKAIGSYYQYVRKWKVIDVCGCAAQLPEDSVKVEHAIFGDHGECCGDMFYTVFSNPTMVNLTGQDSFLVVDVGGSNFNDPVCGIVPYGYQDNKLIFDIKPNQDKVTIQYIGYKTDCDGFVEIGENHKEAIVQYILHKWLMRKQKKTSAEFSQMNWHYVQWSRECAHARALDAELTETEREEIAQMFHDPYSGRGLYVGMKTNGAYGYGGYNY